MRKWIKRGFSLALIPLAKWYLRTERSFSYGEIRVKVHPGVFHPGLFSSTLFLLSYLEKQQLKNQTLLELGCGTGLISLVSARKGATVWASDINAKAIENAKINATQNRSEITFVQSNLFETIASQHFDWIIINPPYYARKISALDELAWHCGENFEYFHQLFQTLNNYMHEKTQVIMVLTAGCDLSAIFSIARLNSFRFELVDEKKVFFDGKDFLYRLQANRQTQV
jgi:release factor glutamine methyltransferase